jgi:hypothetical protein
LKTFMDARRLKLWAWHLLALIFFIYLFSISTNFSINDPDVWWHLKTGEYIVKAKHIPDKDIFSYTAAPELRKDQIPGFQSSWLGQVVLYFFYKAGGLSGIAFLRGLLIVLPLFAVYLWVTGKGGPPWLVLAGISFGGFMLATELYYSFERPQGFSFLFAVLAVILLEELRKKRTRVLILLPILMALWSNIHGGFIVGVFVLEFYLLGETITYLFNKTVKKSPERVNTVFFMGVLAGILATGLNPNSYALFFNYMNTLKAVLRAYL